MLKNVSLKTSRKIIHYYPNNKIFQQKIFQFSIDIALRINKKKQNSNKKTFVQKKAANSVLKKFTTWGID